VTYARLFPCVPDQSETIAGGICEPGRENQAVKGTSLRLQIYLGGRGVDREVELCQGVLIDARQSWVQTKGVLASLA